MGTVVGPWRLRLILLLVIFATSMYTVSAMFGNLGGEVDESGYFNYSTDQQVIEFNQTDIGTQESTGFTDVLFGLGNFLTFGSIDNVYARVLLNGIMGLVWITIGYIVFTFIKEWIPFT